jgi:DNA invertase Pin-like site-specific DNA recombinase
LSKPQRNKDGTIKADPYGIDAQRKAIQSAAEYNGWDLVDVVVDNGKTGTNTKRDGYQRALAMLSVGEADILVAARYDRLTRSTKDLIDLMETSVRGGWAVSILDQRVDTSTAVGRLMARTLASHAEFERDLIAERTKAALAVLRDQGVTLGRPVVVSPMARDLIIKLASQGLTPTAIARRLTQDGIKPPTKKGKRWHHSVVIRVLERAAA